MFPGTVCILWEKPCWVAVPVCVVVCTVALALAVALPGLVPPPPAMDWVLEPVTVLVEVELPVQFSFHPPHNVGDQPAWGSKSAGVAVILVWETPPSNPSITCVSIRACSTQISEDGLSVTWAV